MVKVSVVIPTYNEENYIEKALKSLQSQSFKDFEIIVVDDGSTDRTRDIIRKFDKATLIEGEHKGPAFSRNIGARIAKGGILVFVDADMTFHKDYIKNLILPIKKDNKIIGTTHDFEIATNIENKCSRLWGKVRVSREEAKEVKIFRAIRKEKFLGMGGFDSKYGYADDQTFWFKYGIKPFVAKNTICYHRNPESFNETYKQARWIGTSWKTRFIIFSIPIINLIAFFMLLLLFIPSVFIKAIKTKVSNKDLSFHFIYNFYYNKFKGYLAGLLKSILLNEVRK